MTKSVHINTVKSIVNEGEDHFFFICNDVVHALGLSGLFDRFSIISYDNSTLVDTIRKAGTKVHLLEDEHPRFDMLKSTNNLISHEYVKKIVSGADGRKNLLVFKNSAIIEDCAKYLGLNLLAAQAKISRGIENKVSFYKELESKDINLLPGEIIVMSDDVRYGDIAGKYGETFVLQASKGFAGNKTYLIRCADDFIAVRDAYKKRRMRLTKFISGETVSVNACATGLGTIVKPPFHQLTGFNGLTSNEMGACGNDFYIKDIDGSALDDIIDYTKKIGGIIYQKGYKGIFGVDYIVSGGKCYFIECNPRFVTSLPIFTRLEIENSEPPLAYFHVLENMGKMERVKDIFNKFKTPVSEYTGSQIIMHNLSDETKRIKADMKCGIYSLHNGTLKFVRDGFTIGDLTSDDEFLIIAKAYGKQVNGGMECARIITKGRAINGGWLDDKPGDLVKNLYQALI
jgi:hypothetical protein